MRKFLASILIALSFCTGAQAFDLENYGSFEWESKRASDLLVNLPLTSNLWGKYQGALTFTRASSQWYQDDSGVWQVATSGNPAITASKGILLEPASTNKCTAYGVIPADSYGSTRSNGYALVKGVKYEIISRSTLDFTTVGAANNTAGTQFVATSGTLGAGDSVKDVLYGVGTKSYWTGAAFQQNHTNMTLSGDHAAILSTVDDTAALTAAGLIGIAPSGKVYKLDNSAGTTMSNAAINSQVGNTNIHTVSAFTRGSGTTIIRLNVTGVVSATSAEYTRKTESNVTPSDVTRALRFEADAGAIVYFIVPQLEELPFATSPIPTAGASATRAATSLTLTTPTTAKAGIYTNNSNVSTIGSVSRWQWASYTNSNNYIGLLYDGTNVVFRKRVSGTNYDATKALTVVAGTPYKVGWRINADNSTDIFVNGVKGTGNSNTAAPVWGSNIAIGNDGNNANGMNGRIRNFKVYRTVLSDAAM